jgi:hypothetical protein
VREISGRDVQLLDTVLLVLAKRTRVLFTRIDDRTNPLASQ